MIAEALALLTLLAPSPAAAQGFAGLGTDAEGYRVVAPGREFRFPEDHGAHPGYRIEWWYVTAVLEGPEGGDYGVQWTLFRQALTPDPAQDGWSAPQVWMAHAGVTWDGGHLAAERFGRGGTGQAGAVAQPFRAWLDDWRFESLSRDQEADWSPLRLAAHGEGFAYDLTVTQEGPFVLHGQGGYSQKSRRPDQASYYVSNPFLTVAGTLTIEGREIPVTGRAWLDREWSSQPLDPDQTGWDWFSLHLPEGEKLMAFRLRSEDGSEFRSGSWIEADGTLTPLTGDELSLRPLGWTERPDGRRAPTDWALEVPGRGLSVRARAVQPDAWMDLSVPYWEGPVRFEGSHEGRGYLEMTGW